MNIISSPAEMKKHEEVLRYAAKGIIEFGRTFLQQDFLMKEQTPNHHRMMAENMKDIVPGSRMCNVIFRGGGKSIITKASILYNLYFSDPTDIDFIAFVCETKGQALSHTNYIKNQLEFNQSLRYYFGDFCGGSVGRKWTESEFETSRGDRILAAGTGQRLRGRAQGSVRYTGIVLDDFEGEDNTKTPEARNSNREWISSVVYPALEETVGKEGWIILNGTIVHFDSFLQNRLDGWLKAKEDNRDYMWKMVVQAITNDGTLDGDPAWPDRFPSKKIKQIYSQFVDAGTPHKFAQEYLNDARDISSASFNVDKLKDYSGTYSYDGSMGYLITPKWAIPINVYIGVDTARTATTTSDFQAIMVIGLDSDGNRYVLDMFHNRIPQYDMPAKILEYARKYHPRRVDIEKNGAEMMKDAIDRWTADDHRFVPGLFQGIPAPTRIKKEDKLEAALAPIINNGRLFIKKDQHQELVDEAYQFPKGKRDDLLDALYNADHFARPPRSPKIPIEDFKKGKPDTRDYIVDDDGNKVYIGRKTDENINWVTGI